MGKQMSCDSFKNDVTYKLTNHTHTHTHIYIYIYIYMCVCVCVCVCVCEQDLTLNNPQGQIWYKTTKRSNYVMVMILNRVSWYGSASGNLGSMEHSLIALTSLSILWQHLFGFHLWVKQICLKVIPIRQFYVK